MAAHKTKRLNARYGRFVAEYMVDFNATAAAGRAGFSLKNRAIGTKLVAHPLIADEIRRQCLAVQTRLEMNGDDIRRAFARIATDPRSEAEGGPGYEPRIKALRELGKLLGLYTAKIEVRGSLTLVDLLLAADKAVHVEQAVTH
jgi:hypothetical protein